MIKLGITGYPLAYTRSPSLHRKFLREKKRRGSYEPIPFDPAKGKKAFFKFLDSLGKDGFVGLNVTVPHKEWAFEFAGKRGRPVEGVAGKCATFARAANTLIFSNGHVRSANTDSSGFWQDLARWPTFRRAARSGFDLMIVGTGGSARGVFAGVRAGCVGTRGVLSIRIWGRDEKKISELVKIAGSAKRLLKEKRDERHPLLIVWCLPPLAKPETTRIYREALRHRSDANVFIYDLNYAERSKTTRGLVVETRRRTGIGMLELQAKSSFSLWMRFSKKRSAKKA